uniref:Reverse transcriptase domain-containing protein n=1 Tax=Physcomitrium patens TaxID=3218 RepID=A0A2K1IWN5_PHYPA|nr:hypothetical protein PHYPA_023506 [Physcomitrium patens]
MTVQAQSFRESWVQTWCQELLAAGLIELSNGKYACHVKHLQAVFEKLRQWGLRLHHGKCKFFYDRLPYLGHMIVFRGSWHGTGEGRCVVEDSGLNRHVTTLSFYWLDELPSPVCQEL